MNTDTRLGRFDAIGTTDENTTCDCCGKSNLKMTVVLRDADGEFYFYGRTCAARATRTTSAQVGRAAGAAESRRQVAAGQAARYTEYLATEEGLIRFLAGNRVAFDRYAAPRVAAIEWLTKNLERAQAESFIPERVAA